MKKQIIKTIAAGLVAVLMLALCSCAQEPPASQREENALIIAVNGSVNFDDIALRYNAKNPGGLPVKVVDYREGGTTESAVTRLNMELAAGKGPDIIDFESFPQRNIYAQKGLLTELSQYFSDDFTTEQFYLLDKISGNGLYYVPSSFMLMTSCGALSLFGDKTSWTFDDFGEIINNKPSGVLCPDTALSFLEMACVSIIPHCVDYSAGTCDFTRDEFKKLLKTAALLPQTSAAQAAGFRGDAEYLYRISSISLATDLKYIEQDCGQKVRFVGSPTVDGASGNYLYLFTLAGINARSKHQAEAWEFIKYMISDEGEQAAQALSQIPLKKSVCKSTVDNLLNPYAKYDGHELTLNDDGSFSVDGVYMDQVYDPSPVITPEQAGEYYRLIDSAITVYDYDPSIFDIIKNAAQRYFAGNYTPDEAAEEIQSRVSIYLAEQYG